MGRGFKTRFAVFFGVTRDSLSFQAWYLLIVCIAAPSPQFPPVTMIILFALARPILDILALFDSFSPP